MEKGDSRLLLLIDDDRAQIRLVASIAGRAGWRTRAVAGVESALATLTEEDKPRAILLDAWLTGDDSCQAVARLRAAAPRLPILLMTGGGSPLVAVEAMRAGASDYLVKPLAAEQLLYALDCADHLGETDELAPLIDKIDVALGFETMIGSAPDFRSSLARAAKAARGHAPVLIAGEPGTGKKLLARAIHASSPRSKVPLRTLQCSGLAAGHLTSALYGHEKGAFPGAFEAREGALRDAEGGTLLIANLERLPPDLQDRLAETIATGEVQPIGAGHKFRIDVRILATARGEAGLLVAQRVLGERLGSTLEPAVALPPLRQRTGDIGPLANHFLNQIGEQPGLRKLGITDEALALLESYEWPGNLRQLQAVLFRAAVFCDRDALAARDFPQLRGIVGNPQPRPQAAGAGVALFGPDGHLRDLNAIEADVIRLAIGHYRGRMSEVARRLGIGRSTLYRKLSALGIDDAA